MTDPKLKSVNVEIRYSADDGFSSKQKFSGNKKAPQEDLLAALEELARLTALFGFEDKALEVFNGARDRVFAWRKER